MRTRYEKFRIPVSRLAAAIAAFFLLFSSNRWAVGHEAIAAGLFTLGMFLVAIGALGRMWCSLYIAGYKDQVLITQGPYSTTRNPLYFFSTFGALGIGFCTETLTFPLLLLAVMILYYPLVVRKEERRLRARFGGAFDDYARRVPAFFPNFALFSEPDTHVVKPVVYRRHMFSALWFVWIVGLLELAEGLKEIGWMPAFWSFR
ncbi:MAG TPA: isoprenylcysteine carboxylmethyltransferase family protein [Kiritimatiellia bacterium]|nr:isoprenylcysteine carboxylmethyltransferase family protein [Kiritimatiellia bacterium]